MNRLLTGVLLSAVACMPAASQSSVPAATEQKTGSEQTADWHFDKPEVLRLIALNEAAAQDGEATHADRKRLVIIYSNLGVLYTDAGMLLKSENAIRRAIVLLANGPQDQLADEIGQLAVLHMAMDQVRQAERGELQALQIREGVADPVGIALAESDLASLYGLERKFPKALDYSERAYDVLADRQDVGLPNRIGVRQTLGFALTSMRNCDRGIEVLKDALDLAKSSPGPGSLSVGCSEYVLGVGYWHCSDRDHAAEWLERGTTDMRAEYGWAHAMYVNAMKQYARFLRANGQRGAAASAEAVVHQAESVVDVNALTGRAQGFRSSPSN